MSVERISGLYGMLDVTEPIDTRERASACAERASHFAERLLDGGVRVIQLRAKNAGAGAFLDLAGHLRTFIGTRALFIVNDRLDVALAAGADGVHLGQDDLPLSAALSLVKRDFLIGISTHNEAQALAAAEGGASYIGFGPIFATRSKERPDPVVGIERLAVVCRTVAIPVVAIGGIELSNIASVANAGARGAAVISAVSAAANITEAARAFGAAFSSKSL